jgi:tripartite-type tricarboxylate transporter receptor subunit TctC
MSLVRRQFLRLAGGAATLPMIAHFAKAEGFPARPIHIVNGFPPVGGSEVAARLIAQPLQQRMGQPVVVENRPGAGGNIGAEVVIRAPPDGYTLIVAGANNSINATLYKNLPFDFIRDVAMVAGIMRGPFVMVVNPTLEARNVTEFIAYAKANPGKINMASSGNGTVSHLAGELFKMLAGVDLVHVPYRGEEGLADLMAGQMQVTFANLPAVIGFIRAGRLRALAVTTATRWPALPEVPPVADAVPGYEVSGWFALGAPKATPADTIAALNKAVNASLAEPAIAHRMRELGAEPMVMSPGELDAFVAADTQRWAKAVKFSGAKVD